MWRLSGRRAGARRWRQPCDAPHDGFPRRLARRARHGRRGAAHRAAIVGVLRGGERDGRAPNRLTTPDACLRVRRPGRKVALGRNQRRAVWDVINADRSAAAVQGIVDFGVVCAIAAQLGRAVSPRLADHVLVDEGQDLTPAQWQFLRSLVTEGPDDLFIADESQRRIYGQPVVLGRYDTRIVGRSRRLSLNHRTKEQVLRFASSVLAGTEYVDLDDEATDELDRAAEHIGGWLDAGVQPNAIGILARDQRTVDIVARGLEDRGVSVRQITRSVASAKHPQLMTMHRAKGMEFAHVLIFGVDAELVPRRTYLRTCPKANGATCCSASDRCSTLRPPVRETNSSSCGKTRAASF